MTTTSLGSGMTPRGVPRDELLFKSDVEGTLARCMTDLERRLQAYINGRMPSAPKDPVVNVTVPVPTTTVRNEFAPNFAPRFEPQIDVEVEGLEALSREQAKTNDLLIELRTMLARPVTRTVFRDADGLIDRVVESR